METDDFFAKLDAADNESDVRARIAGKQYNQFHAGLAQEWLRRREDVRSTASASKPE